MEKQIIEMSEEILQEYTNCYSEADQECLEKMLRKLASEVSREIFEEIDRMCIDTFGNFNHRVFAELKKKYTEEVK